MSVLKLKPAYKDYIWGGDKLKTLYNKQSDLDIVAESWELSCHPDGPGIIDSGDDAGKTLVEYIDQKPSCLGTHGSEFERFPVLIKLIDSKDPASVQVHPNDEYAKRVEHEYGKTEMWYILDCKPGAYVYYGVDHTISKEEFKQRIEDNTILSVLNKVYVKPGDILFIASGTIHAVMGGIVFCEIQQNSNTTYRVYDYGRPRPLHIDKAMDVSKLDPIENNFKPIGPSKQNGDATYTLIRSCEYFTVYEYDLDGNMEINLDETSFGSILIIDGETSIENNGETLDAIKGDSFFIDADTKNINLKGKCKFLYTRV